MRFSKPVKICAHCGFAVSLKSFLNKTFFVREDSRLIEPIGNGTGRLQGCIYCLQLLEADEAGKVEKTEFDNRTIYTIKPSLKDSVTQRLSNFFNHKPKTKVRNP